MRSVALFSALIVLGLLGHFPFAAGANPQAAPSPEYAALKAQAERLYADGSFAKAAELYQRADGMELPASEARWVDFRLADTLWRSQAGTQTHDSTKYDKAAKDLEALINAIEREEDRDLVWAESHESLADFRWARDDYRDWGGAWPHYQAALDWWAGSSNLDAARDRYLSMVWRMSEPEWMHTHHWYHYGYVPLEVQENALKIAKSDNDKAHANFLIAMTLLHRGGSYWQLTRLPAAFDAAIGAGKSTLWHDDALYAYGEWMANSGPVTVTEDGSFRQEPDYITALKTFQQILRDYAKGETRHYDNAKAQIENITRPVLNIGVSNIFLPDSEVQYHLSWRNIGPIALTLYKVDLPRDVDLKNNAQGAGGWIETIDLAAAEQVRSWTKENEDKKDYKPGSSSERLDAPLPPGAYVLQAAAGGVKVRDIVLVTDAAVVLKTVNDQALAFVCDALTGAPLPEAKVRLWRLHWNDNNHWIGSAADKTTDASGLCLFQAADFPKQDSHNVQYFAAVSLGDRQAIATSGTYWGSRDLDAWRIYAFTDRPAYRPEETVQWKLIARTASKTGYQTPTDTTLYYEIADPRGSKVSEGEAKLNAFGSAWGELALTAQMPLGEYRVNYWLDSRHEQHIGAATLFRLEEYKLPEFQVAISTPRLEDGRKQTYRMGDRVEVNIQADYYFGGPVANATVEVIIYQQPHYHWWRPVREYAWCYEQPDPWRYWGGGEQIMKRETLRTDATGAAKLAFDTDPNSGQDFQYRIEARVTDASRREIVNSDTIRVTRQRYYVNLTPRHYLYKPQDKVEIDVEAKDANDAPVQVEGTVFVTRERWEEIWIDSEGNEVKGAALQTAIARSRIFPPPPPRPGLPGWRLKYSGYRSEDILKTTVKLDAEGKAVFAFTPAGEGYFRVRWKSDDPGSAPIVVESYVWVGTEDSKDVGYRAGGVEIIADKDTFRSGQSAPVMITTPTNGRYVLFCVEGDNLHSYQVVHVPGTVKLIQVPIDQRHVPNIYLDAVMAHAGQLFQDREEIVIPPVEQYLNVEITADRSQYQPGEEGRFTVSTRDHDGKPVSAEVALALVDESVTYIQQDYAGDPRPFFFERRQNQIVQTQSTFNQKAFIKLVEDDEKQLIDDRLTARLLEEAENARDQGERFRDVSGDLGATREMSAARGGGGSIFDDPGDGRYSMAKSARGGMPAAQSAGPTGSPALDSALAMDELRQDAGELKLGAPGGDGPAVQVRSDFRSTLLWEPAIVTDENGVASVSLKYADSLTTWKATARVAAQGNRFGMGTATTRTKMPLIARLQAPRFFVVGDIVTVSGIINNNTDQPQIVTPELDAEGLSIAGMLKDGQLIKSAGLGTVEVAANSESRVDWQINVESPGAAKLKLTAKSDSYADAMEKSYTVHEHGVEKFIAKSGKVRGAEVVIGIDLPAERRVDSATLMVQVSPSMAVTMLDSLPYLIDYPYGCTEQTMSRFLPTVITAKTLKDLGISPEVALAKVFGGIEQQHADKTHTRAKQDLARLQEMVNAGLDRLYDFQHGDGGWGWWKEGESDHFMTAYVLWGLCMASQAELDVRRDVIDRAAAFLDGEIVEAETSPDLQAWLLHALAAHHTLARPQTIGKFQQTAFDNLWKDRSKLNAYTRSLLALSAHSYGDEARAKTLVENLENGVKRDDRPDVSVVVKGAQGPNDAVMGTAHWGEDGVYWRWSDGGVEATAFALRAMLAIDPKNKLIEPVTNWLVKNRRGAQWSNTRDTAMCVLALNDYLRTSGELSANIEYELFVNGNSIASRKLSAEDAIGAPSRFAIDPRYIRDGSNEIRIVRKNAPAEAPIYFSAEATYFSLEEPIPAAGNEIFVRRDYYKLVARPTLLKGIVYDRLPLKDGESVKSGERIEVIMTVEAKNNYEYLVFEDLKPAGLEAVAVRSGASVYAKELKSGAVARTFGDGARPVDAVMAEQAHGDAADYTGRSRWVYQELRDRKVALFLDRLPEGVWEIRYDLRAETPGRFHALPTLGHAMYTPEVRCNSQEIRISVTE